jgi:hypothetical protein
MKMNEQKEEMELVEMEEMLKQIGPSIPVPEPGLREEILKKSRDHWQKKSVFPIRFLAGWAALVALAAIINYSAKSLNTPDKTPEIVEEETVTDDEYKELKNALDKVMRGHR